jgi:hypothetical protein
MVIGGFLLGDDLQLKIAGAAFEYGDLVQQFAKFAAHLIDLITPKPHDALKSACHLSQAAAGGA